MEGHTTLNDNSNLTRKFISYSCQSSEEMNDLTL